MKSRSLAMLAALSALAIGAPRLAFAQSTGLQVLPGGCGTANYAGSNLRPGTQTATGLTCGSAALGPSSAIIGKVGIDQTTPGTTNLVAVTPSGSDVFVTPTIQNASYVSGNCMGGFQTVPLGTAQSVESQISLASQGGLVTAKQIYEFSTNPTASTCTDKGTFTIATADLSKLLWTGSITPAAPTGTTKTWGASSSLGLGLPKGGTVYVAIVETTTETPATTSDLVLGFSSF